MTVTLNFHGAAGTVTGSCYRIVHPGGQFLVDCGLFQGNKTVRDLNYKPLPFEPKANSYYLFAQYLDVQRDWQKFIPEWEREKVG